MKKHVLIIAEAGVNHNGDMGIARDLILKAHESGADIIKFQSFKTERLVSKSAQLAEYQKSNSTFRSQFELLKSLELSQQNHIELQKYAEEIGIEFLSSAFDVEGLEELSLFKVRRIKIPSGEITNYPYLHSAGRQNLPVIMSTGMSTSKEVANAVDALKDAGLSLDALTLLHCNTEYPTPMSDVNLKAMMHMGEEHGVDFGYSDHTEGIEVPIAAAALGAKIIEKHFTLDKTMVGPDHAASLEPEELSQMVSAIRNVEVAISGSGEKIPSDSEMKNRLVVRKSLYLQNSMKAGSYISEKDLIALRPGDGICAMQWHEVIGKRISESLEAGTKLSWELLE